MKAFHEGVKINFLCEINSHRSSTNSCTKLKFIQHGNAFTKKKQKD